MLSAIPPEASSLSACGSSLLSALGYATRTTFAMSAAWAKSAAKRNTSGKTRMFRPVFTDPSYFTIGKSPVSPADADSARALLRGMRGDHGEHLEARRGAARDGRLVRLLDGAGGCDAGTD